MNIGHGGDIVNYIQIKFTVFRNIFLKLISVKYLPIKK